MEWETTYWMYKTGFMEKDNQFGFSFGCRVYVETNIWVKEYLKQVLWVLGRPKERFFH